MIPETVSKRDKLYHVTPLLKNSGIDPKYPSEQK